MPQHKSAAKRVVTNEKRRQRNAGVRSAVKTVSKRVRAAADPAAATQALREAYSTLDKAAKKGVHHRRTAARRKSRLARAASHAQAAAPTT